MKNIRAYVTILSCRVASTASGTAQRRSCSLLKGDPFTTSSHHSKLVLIQLSPGIFRGGRNCLDERVALGMVFWVKASRCGRDILAGNQYPQSMICRRQQRFKSIDQFLLLTNFDPILPTVLLRREVNQFPRIIDGEFHGFATCSSFVSAMNVNPFIAMVWNVTYAEFVLRRIRQILMV